MVARMTGWKRAHLPIALLLLVAMTGCSSVLVGSWKTEPIPTGEAFYIKQAQFKDDGTYTAVAKRGEENIKLAGSYEFNGFDLKLKTPGKPERTYPATYFLGGKLRLKSADKKYTMIKQ